MGRVLQVVGYQNSGKTTFVLEYIKAAVENQLKVGTIKHHGHGGELELNDHKKDTGKHRNAGAHVSLVEGNNTFILSAEKHNLTLSQLISLYQVFDLDIVLVEGFKFEEYPKVVLLRSEEDVPMLEKLVNVCCIVANFPISQKYRGVIPIFIDMEPCITWLLTNKAGENIDNSNV